VHNNICFNDIMAGGKKCSKGCRCGKHHQKGGAKFNLGTALNVASALLPIAQQLSGNGLRGGSRATFFGGWASHKTATSRKHKQQVRVRGSGLRPMHGSGPLSSALLPLLASLLPI
jgi:hypothetical protein